jgi:hypothetical protein
MRCDNIKIEVRMGRTPFTENMKCGQGSIQQACLKVLNRVEGREQFLEPHQSFSQLMSFGLQGL